MYCIKYPSPLVLAIVRLLMLFLDPPSIDFTARNTKNNALHTGGGLEKNRETLQFSFVLSEDNIELFNVSELDLVFNN
jgi:hypothetical protein